MAVPHILLNTILHGAGRVARHSGRSAVLSAAFSNSARADSRRHGHPRHHIPEGYQAIGAVESVVLELLKLKSGQHRENTDRIQSYPAIVLDIITRQKSVFNEGDVARTLHRYIDDASPFQDLVARVLQCPEILQLDRERTELGTGVRLPVKYTTREMVRLEVRMANQAVWLSQRPSHGLRKERLEATFARHESLSDEQKIAIQQVAGPGRIAAVIGRAGAGKTTTMKAANEAWTAARYQVYGGAVAGKAAEGLQDVAGMPSRTLAAWEWRWSQGQDELDEGTIFVIDEAGMVPARQMALFVETVTMSGAKLVLIGDPQQLQPIEAGAPFRTIADLVGYAELDTIYRQREQWMRDASLDLARGNVGKAIEAYRANGKIFGTELSVDAITNLIADWDRDYDAAKSTLILAYLRRDVRILNDMARAKLVERGVIEPGFPFRTALGVRKFARGDPIIFLKNDVSLRVKNGRLARVIEAQSNHLVAEVGENLDDELRYIGVAEVSYDHIDHGYATTIHKSQGATVDRVKVLASPFLDRHLTYVAMTRHREDLGVYYSRQSFEKTPGFVAMLSRKNAKEATLDYARSGTAAHPAATLWRGTETSSGEDGTWQPPDSD